VSDGRDLQNDLAVIAYSTRVRTGLRARVIVGVSRGGEVGGRSELRGLSPDLLKVVQTANF
jgi:hypothetical protein